MIELTFIFKLLGLVALLFLYGVCIGLSYRLFVLVGIKEDEAYKASHLWPITIPFYVYVGQLFMILTLVKAGINWVVRGKDESD